MSLRSRRVALALTLSGCGTPSDPESGLQSEDTLPPLEPRPSEISCSMLGTPPNALPRVSAEVEVGSATFDEPIQLLADLGGGGMLVVESTGRVWKVDATGNRAADPWLDLGSEVAGPPLGLLAIAIADGWVYAHYHRADAPERTRVVRIPIVDGALDPADALTMIEFDHGSAGLASGAIGGALGLDSQGLLLIGVGDGTSAPDPSPSDAAAQDAGDWRGSLLRIAAPVDPTQAGYDVPPDNPWASDPSARPEVFAIGLHDPRFLVLGEGTSWIADRGTGIAEEFSRAAFGGNLGWPVTEGWTCTGMGDCDATSFDGPSFEYQPIGDHCGIVAGGLVTGSELPLLAGALVWADVCSGRIWGFDPTPAQGVPAAEVLGRVAEGVAALGTDADGNPWLIDGQGRLAQLHTAEHGEPGSLPDRISATQCFGADLASPTAGLVPYLVGSPLWSDGLLKQRFMVVPPGEYIEVDGEGRWQFPDGSVLIKTFVLEAVAGDPTSRRPIETRFMVRRDDVWDFYGYRWRADGSDADLLGEGASEELTVAGPTDNENFVWEFPSVTGCRTCHGFGDAEALGPTNLQMNRLVHYGDEELEQISALAAIDLFADSPGEPAGLPRLVDPADGSASVEARARAYLHANCAHCHQPTWMRPDLRWTTPFADTQTCGELIEFPSPDVAGSLRIDPGVPANSNLWLRMAVRGDGQMPMLGTGRVDVAGLALIEEWIEALDECP